MHVLVMMMIVLVSRRPQAELLEAAIISLAIFGDPSITPFTSASALFI